MAFSEILQTVGIAGRFQVIHVVLLVFPILMLASHNLMQNFSAATPDHHCRIPWLENASLHAPQDALWNLTKETLLRVAIPWEQDSLSSCRRYVQPQWQLMLNGSADVSNLTEIEGCVDGWEFDSSSFSSTIITEWDVVCDTQVLKQMAQSVYMGGVLVGAIIAGTLADKFGRRSVMLANHLLVGIGGICAAFAPNVDIYMLARFFTGAFLSGSVLNAFSLGLEWLDTNHRVHFTSFVGYCYTFGQFTLAGFAYGIRDWRYLQLAASVPYIFFFLIGWFHPESSRWLMLQGNYDEALKGFKKVARINGKHEAADALNAEILKKHVQTHHSGKSLQKTYTFVDLCRTSVLRRRTFIVSLIWFATSFSYYGLAMNLHGFGFEIYIVMLMFAVADFPAKLGAFVIACYIGRRVALATLLFLAGSACLALVFIPQDLRILRTIMAVIGKGSLGGSFNVVLLLTGEMYPTLMRQNAIGSGSTTARMGAMIAPLVTIMGELYPLLPQIIYGTISIIAGFSTFYLPETLNVPLPDTMDDVKLKSCHMKRQDDQSAGEKQDGAKESPLLQKIPPNKDVKCSFETSTNSVKIVEEVII